MEKLLELSDVTLIPREINEGWGSRKINYLVDATEEVTGIQKSLPIFTSPMESVVGINSWKTYQDSGIKPILPRTVDLSTRLDACGYIFSAFSIQEVVDNFIRRDMRSSQVQFHICIDSGNGHESRLLDVGQKLKQLYGGQIILMGGNIANPKSYVQYCRSGFDYVRLGISSGSLVSRDKFGFHYPMASLLISIHQIKKSGNIQKSVKLVVDGGIRSHSDIMKAIALGADYVMIGREFAKLVEAEGTLYRKTTKPGTKTDIVEEIENPENLLSLEDDKIKKLDLSRQYFGNTTLEMQALREGFTSPQEWIQENPKIRLSDSTWEWIDVKGTLRSWISELKECISYGFMMASATSWNEYKEKIIYGRIS